MKAVLKKVIWFLIIVLLIALGFYLGGKFANQASSGSENTITSVEYACDGGKTIQAIYYDGKVTLNLSDGRTMNLQSTISASGARYANYDESFVFWNKGSTAFVEENGETTYENCNETE